MKTSRLLMLAACILCTFSLSAQLRYKLQLMPNGTRWGVYVTQDPGIVISPSAFTATAQVTLVAPLNYTILDLVPVSGNWLNNANVNGPAENPTKSYISFGFVNDPPMQFSNPGPTLLFTFKKSSNFCPDEFYLIENLVDPFDHLPNSMNTNPGNEMTVFDIGATPPQQYSYSGNYAPYAWDCHDCDGDGIPNALEDTNGNGVYDAGIDVSDLCNGAGGGCIAITGAQLQCENGGTGCGDNPAGQISLAINISGGEAPFAVKYSDGSNVFNLTDYQSGTPFSVDAVNGAVYSIVSVTGNDGCEADANDLQGEVAVTFPSALQFVTQPTGATVCNGDEVIFSACATASNTTFSFSWQYSSDNGTTWQAVPLGTIFNQTNTGTYTDGCDELVVGSTFGLQGYRFRAVTSGNGVPAVYSQAASLQLQGPVQITAQPQSATVCAGEGAVFTATVTNNGAGTASYQWQSSSDGGLNWVNVADNTNYSGSTTATLNVSNSTGMVNRRFRLAAQAGSCTPVYSDPAQLTVEGPVEILSVISPVTVCRGADACFEVQAALLGNGQLSYQWQERAVGSTTWTDVQGASASTFCLSNSEGHNGYCYRAMVRTASCPAVISVEACLVVEDVPVFAQQPQNTTTCVGETATLSASAGIDANYAGQVDYRWQASADGGLSWQNLDNDSNFAGTYGNVLTISDIASLGNLQYRLSATSGICGASYSTAASVAVEGPVEISEQPVATTVCPGSSASFSAAANLLGAGNLHLQWQSSTDGIAWANIAEGNNYTGTQSSTLTVQNATASRMFRLSAATGVCAAAYSTPAMLTVEAPIVFSLQPESVVVCPDETVAFSATVGNAGLSLQWQSSTDGQTWTDLSAGSVFAGVNAETLNIADVTGLDGVQFRLVAASQNCHANSVSAVLVLEEESICNPTPTNYDCVSLAVKKLDGGIGWSVWAKADSSFTETPYQLPTAGRVTLVAPLGFAIQALTSHNGGKWKPGKVTFNPAQDPGKVYFEFNLTPNQNFLQLGPGVERLLFTFSVVNGCPNSLSLMEGIVPPGHFPNQFAGFGAGLTAESIPFHFCGVYGKETWECPPSTSNLMAPTGGNNSVTTGQQIEVGNFFEVAPNPVRDELRVTLDENILEKMPSLRLLNLQGQVVFQTVIEGEATRRLDMSGTTPGIYFLALEVDGKLVQREKIIVQ